MTNAELMKILLTLAVGVAVGIGTEHAGLLIEKRATRIKALAVWGGACVLLLLGFTAVDFLFDALRTS